MEQLKQIKKSLVASVQGQLGNLKKVDAKEMGEVIDMIKDLEEAMYYCAITEAMEKSAKEKEEGSTNINYYMEPMYYSGNGSGRGGSNSNQSSTSSGNNGGTRNYVPYMEYAPYMMRDNKWRDERMYDGDRSSYSRRMYMETKQNHKGDQQASSRELEKYIRDLGDDISDMISDSSIEDKQMLAQKLQQLATKINTK